MTIEPYQEERPWGNFRRFTENEPSTVKILTINPGEELSLQQHAHREEFWHVTSGEGDFTIEDTVSKGTIGDEFFIPIQTKHTMKATGDEPLVVLEISFGAFDESDITRLKDKYGRSS